MLQISFFLYQGIHLADANQSYILWCFTLNQNYLLIFVSHAVIIVFVNCHFGKTYEKKKCYEKLVSLFKHVERRQLTEIVFYQAKGFKIGQKKCFKASKNEICHVSFSQFRNSLYHFVIFF